MVNGTPREQLEQRQREIAAAALPTPTAAQVRARGRAALAREQLQRRQLEVIKEVAREELVPFAAQVTEFEQAQAAVRAAEVERASLESDISIAKRVALSDDPRAIFAIQTPRQQELFIQFQESFQAGELRADILRQLQFTPAPAEDILQQTLLPFTPAPLEALVPFTRLPPTIPTLPPLTVEAVPDLSERFRIAIREERPDLRFIPTQKLERGIESLVGIGFGTTRIIKEQFLTTLSQLRTASGGFVFTPKEAEGISELGVEIGEGLLLGKGVGKLSVLLRGGFLAALPKAVKQSNKFKNVVKAADITLLAALGTAEGLRITNIVKTQGTDAAIIESIGLLSFGVGFSKAGLASDPVAEREFKRFVKTISDASIKGKRGQVPIGRKRKRKKGELQLLDDLIDPIEAEELRNVIGEIERRLLNERTIEGQKKIIAELRKGIKTPRAEKEFNEFVLSLVEKNILKVPKVEVAPGVVQKGFVPKTKGFEKMGKLNKKRLTKNIIKNKSRIERSKLPLSERLKIRQQTETERLSVAGRIVTTTRFAPISGGAALQQERFRQLQKVNQATSEIEKQRQKIRQLQAQGASQETIQKELQKLKTLQNERQKLRTKQLQTLKTKQKTLQKERLKLLLRQKTLQRLSPRLRSLARARARKKPRRPRPRKIGIPRFPIPKKKVKKKPKVRLRAPPSEFGIFVRKRGKDIRIGTRKTRPAARKFLKKRLTTTLRASGFITDKTGKKIRPKITKGFRLSKIDPRRIVEKRGRRLDTKSEVKAIQAAKLKSTPMIKLKRKRK